ncbi:hypothetical protein GQ53DRAFT_649314 [Thozetella sp. PMI_491]|nr:hypothetical protein GQ53DRAFT_649314 [Thozetella sp. PMI_491]
MGLQERDDPEDAWPAELRTVPAQLSSLPSLGSAYGATQHLGHFQLPLVSDTTLSILQDCLRIPLQGSPWPSVSFATFPKKEQLDHFIDLYFFHFDKFFPFIHRPTFDPAKDFVLTLAMSVIGACYSGYPSARSFATALSELTRRLLLFMAEYDPRFVRAESYISAQVLQSIHGFSSGSKRLYELAENNRSSIISNARCINLFDEHKSNIRDGEDLQAQWDAWLRVEKSRRLAWVIYAYSSSTYFHNSRSLLSMLELRMDLPCSVEHWEAETPQAWAALHPWTDKIPHPLAFRPIMASLFDNADSTIERLKDVYHRGLLLAMLARTFWDAREASYEPGDAAFHTTTSTTQRMSEILTIMDKFSRPLTLATVYPPREPESLAQRMYLVRTTRTPNADDPVDYMHLVWTRGPRAQEAKDHLERWAQQYPDKVRLSAYLGAQLLSIARQYPYNHPREPYHVFHGGFILWTMASLLILPSMTGSMAGAPSTSLRSDSEPKVCCLDWLGGNDTAEAQAIRDWIEHGGNYAVKLHGISDVLSEKGLRQILEQTAETLGRMPVWGIAQNFLNAVLRVLHDEA